MVRVLPFLNGLARPGGSASAWYHCGGFAVSSSAGVRIAQKARRGMTLRDRADIPGPRMEHCMHKKIAMAFKAR